MIELEDEWEFSDSVSRRMLNTIVDVLYLFDDEGNMLEWNRKLNEVTGYSDREISELHPLDFVPDEDEEQITTAIRHVIEEGEEQRVESHLITKNGERIPYEFTGNPFYDDSGELVGLLGSGREIAEFKKRERTYRAELDEMYERISDAFYAVDEEFRFTYVNEDAEKLLQRSEKSLLEKKLWEEFPEAAEIDRVWDAFHRALEEQTTQRYELYYEPLEFWVSATLYPSETGISVYFKDITERKERERQQEQYRAMMEAASDVIVTIDEDGTIRNINPAVEELFGYDPEELVGENLTVLMSEDYRDFHEEGLQQYLETGNRNRDWSNVELPGRRADGSEIPLAISFGEVEHGNETYFIGIIRDISETKKYQRRLEQANERLEQFVYSASHDLKEPLRVARTYAEFLQDDVPDELPEDAREDLYYLQEAVSRMDRLIQSLLKLSRVGRGNIERREVPLDNCANEAMDHLAPRIEESNATINREDLPALKIDEPLVTDLYQNLISNALKYGGKEESSAEITLTADEQNGGWVLGVRDNGPGIPPDKQDKIFRPFHRLSGRSETEGSGMGLAICKRIAQSHGGRIWVESEPGEGTHFKFVLQ